MITAFENEIFLTYAGVTAGLLALAGLVLGALTAAGRSGMAPIWRTYRGWLMMAPAVLLTLAAGRVATILGIMFLAAAGFRELARATGLRRDRWMTTGVYLGIAALTVVALVHDPRLGTPGWYGLYMTLPVYVVSLILIIPITRDRTNGQLQRIALAILSFVYCGWMFGHLAFLANAAHAVGYLLFLIFAVELTDVAAFTCGRLFGRHPLRPAISPKKSLEGALGALAVGLALPWVLGFSLPGFGPLERILTGLIIGAGGQLGDLAISVIKRDIGIKDMGTAIPGHGGVLDRIDSLIFTAPLFFHMVRFYVGLS